MQANIYLSVVTILVLLMLFFLFGSLITYRSGKNSNTLFFTINIGFHGLFRTFRDCCSTDEIVVTAIIKIVYRMGGNLCNS